MLADDDGVAGAGGAFAGVVDAADGEGEALMTRQMLGELLPASVSPRGWRVIGLHRRVCGLLLCDG